ncbi:MAG: PKD domain-containing protein, partial [Candidatus Heimdallarchaeota archaeon]
RKKMVEIMGFDSKKYVKGLIMLTLIVFFIVIFTSVIFANFQAGSPNHSIEKIYGPLFNISGWINISFDEEPIDSLFSAFFDGSPGNSVSLWELLDKNPAYVRSCTPSDCGEDYSATNGASSKIFTLNSGESKILGLKLTGNLIRINSASFKLQSDASIACVNQIEIDLFDDGDIDFINNKIAAGSGCSNLKTYGCYNALENKEEYIMTSVPYCQKMNLSESPGFYLGAWVKNVTGSLNLKMFLYDNYGVPVANCALPEITASEGEVSCSVDYPVSESREYYVCISSIEGTGEYRIRGNSNPSEGCGFYGYPPPSNTPAAYEIFAEGRKFDSVGTIEILNAPPNRDTLGVLIQDYILDKYGGLDCSTECVVPIRFISGINQQITINNLALNYEKTTGIVTDNNFYNLTEIPAKVNSNYQRLFIDKAGFSVPSDLDSYDFSLELNNQEIFSEDIEVKDVPIIKSLIPKATAAAFPTEFTVEVVFPANANVTSYDWDFGDNSTITTPMNKAIHIYSAIGTYNLQITVTDARGLSSSRIFEINVSSPKNLIRATLNKMNTDLQNLKTDIQNQALFHQTSLNSVLRIENISSELEIFEEQFSAATNDSEYMILVGDLLEIRIPENVFKTKQASSFLFFPERSFIDMDIVQSIGGGDYETRRIENYRNAVLAWQQENVDLTMDFNEFSEEYDSDINSLVNIFEIRINEKTDIVHDYYLIIPKLQNIGFDRSVEEKDGFVY